MRKKNKILPILIILSVVTLCYFCRSTTSTDTPTPTASLSTSVKHATTAAPSATNTKVVVTSTKPILIASATVNVNFCNLRKGPGSNYSIVGSSSLGNTHQVYGKNTDGTWLWIDNNKSIWISTSLVDLNIAISSIPVVDPNLLPFGNQSVSIVTNTQEEARNTTQEDLIINIYSILNKNINNIEEIIGKPRTGWDINKGEYEHLPDGGYERIYNYNEYEFVIDYDNKNIAKYFQITEGLRQYNYSLRDWQKITSRLNINNLPDPDFFSNAVIWDNPNGYFIRIFKDSTVWSIQIWINP